MSVGQTFLGLLEEQPRHGYDLKRIFDERFGRDPPLQYGQVYSTLARLLAVLAAFGTRRATLGRSVLWQARCR